MSETLIAAVLKAVARAQADERDRIVTWLRGYDLDRTLGLRASDYPSATLRMAANAIEHGRHIRADPLIDPDLADQLKALSGAP